jgi:phospholipase C
MIMCAARFGSTGVIQPPFSQQRQPHWQGELAMESISKALLLLLFSALGATLALAQGIPAGTFKHVIIVVQENRTPDNLFGAGGKAVGPGCGVQDPFESGVDIENGGYALVNGQRILYCFTGLPLNTWDALLNGGKGEIVDPDHSYNLGNFGWVYDYDNGNMDGFCHVFGSTCPEYSDVLLSDVQPYFDIATGYGFANYMFQSNQGPSMPAHQFLFTGTSSPIAPGDQVHHYDWDYVAENPRTKQGFPDFGCQEGPNGYNPPWVNPPGSEFAMTWDECYTHDSLVTDANDCSNGPDYCDRSFGGLSSVSRWRYYTPTPEIIWNAPAGIPEVCYGENDKNEADEQESCGPGEKSSKEWADHLALPYGTIPYNPGATYTNAPIFDDLYNCSQDMPAISWVIPDGSWSDHPRDGGNATSLAAGPSWVGDIINAVGTACNGKYWKQGQEPTAIFVVWDDWGGWFDHVKPWIARRKGGTGGYTACDPSLGQWGCGYTDGFRVPFLVVSPYTPAHYVSGACDATGYPNCPNFGRNDVYVHDFGSILGFTEWNFGMHQIAPPSYADWNAPDWSADRKTPPLWDFFGSYRDFTSIQTSVPYTCFQYPSEEACFGPSWTSSDPDSY